MKAFVIAVVLTTWLFTAGSCSDGKRAVNAPCETNTDCASEICHAGICASKNPLGKGKPCKGDGECRSFRCQAGVCQEGNRQTSDICRHPDECVSNLCVQGTCGRPPDGGGDAEVDAGVDLHQVPDILAADQPSPDQAAADLSVPDILAADQPSPDQAAADLPVPDKALPDLPVPDTATLKPAGAGCSKANECLSGVCNAVLMKFEGWRNKKTPYNIALSKIASVKTQGALCYNMNPAIIPPFPGLGSLGSYMTLGSPNAGGPPHVMSSKSHSGLKSLSAHAQAGLRFDLKGLSLVTSPILDLRSKGPLSFSDPALKATNNLIYFFSQRKTHRKTGHRSEKRTYKGGTFRILSAASAVLASGTFQYINAILDYDNPQNFGWGSVTVSPGSVLYTELMAAYGNAVMALDVDALQSPIFQDNLMGTSPTYTVFNISVMVKSLGYGICGK